jgi:hypothetical protein
MIHNRNLLMSLGTAIAASKFAKGLAGLELEDVLGTVGLARRRSHALENIAFVGLGVLIGAGVTALFAPASGRETRQRIGEEATKFGQAAKQAVIDQKDDALRSLSTVANGAVANSRS